MKRGKVNHVLREAKEGDKPGGDFSGILCMMVVEIKLKLCERGLRVSSNKVDLSQRSISFFEEVGHEKIGRNEDNEIIYSDEAEELS